MKPTPKVGDTLYSLNIGNNARGRQQVLTPVTVRSVGRKYFACSPENHTFLTEYHLDDWREKTKYSPNYKLYASPQELEDEKEEKAICMRISEAFLYGKNRRNLSLQTLRSIIAVIP